MEPVRIGIVGVQHFHVFSFLETFSKRDGVEIVGVAEADHHRRDRLRKVACLPLFDDFDELVDQVHPDAVALYNPPAERPAAICRCAEQGIHVWTDKPIALTLDGLDRVRQALAGSRIAFMMTVAGGYSAATHRLREMLGSGELGRLVQFVELGQHRFRLPKDFGWERSPWEEDHRQSGGLTLQMAIHSISRFLWLADSPVVAVSAVEGNSRFAEIPEFRDHCWVTLRTDRGAHALVQSSWLIPDADTVHSRGSTSISGTGGSVMTGGTSIAHGLEPSKAEGQGLVVTDDAPPRPFEPGPGPGRSAADDFLAEIRSGTPPLVSRDFLLEVMRTAILAREAGESGKTLHLEGLHRP